MVLGFLVWVGKRQASGTLAGFEGLLTTSWTSKESKIMTQSRLQRPDFIVGVQICIG